MRKLGLTLGLAWRVTGEERYARKLREALLNFTGYERWISQPRLDRPQPWHSDLSTAGLTIGCAAGYEAIYPVLGVSGRRQIAEGMIRLGIRPAMDDWVLPSRRYHSLDSMGHNYYAICPAGAGIGALAVLGDDPNAREWAEAVDSALEQWVGYNGLVLLNKPSNFDPAGGYYESIHYANYACSSYLQFRLARTHALSPSPAPAPLLERWAEFFLHTHYPATGGALSVNFGDDFDGSAAEVMRMLAANGFSPGLARWYLDRVSPESIDPFALLYIDDRGIAAANPLPDSSIYRSIGWATMRNSWENDATLLASCHVAAAIPNFLVCEFHAYDVPFWFELADNVADWFQPGRVTLPDRPGLGADLDEKVGRRYALPGRRWFDDRSGSPANSPAQAAHLASVNHGTFAIHQP